MEQIADKTHLIDLHHCGQASVIGAAVLELDAGVAIIDPGPASTIPVLRSRLHEASIGLPAVVRWLLQTEERNGGTMEGRGGEPVVRLEIPADIQSLKAVSPDLAREWRAKTREAFQSYFARGYRVARFVREPDTERCYYVLTG